MKIIWKILPISKTKPSPILYALYNYIIILFIYVTINVAIYVILYVIVHVIR